jgi:uncharacterized surface protein with fasciclin (FAS1) repeats
MTTNIKKVILTLFVSTAIFFVGCSEDSMVNSPTNSSPNSSEQGLMKPPSQSGNTIVDIAITLPEYSILVEAVVFAGLDGVLSGNRQFTVFAPDNAAFVELLGKLGGISKEQLFVEANKELVTKILLYHVAPGERFSGDVLSSNKVRTMAKEFAMVSGTSIGNDKYGYADINLDLYDVPAANGVIHTIKSVIIPPSVEL